VLPDASSILATSTNCKGPDDLRALFLARDPGVARGFGSLCSAVDSPERSKSATSRARVVSFFSVWPTGGLNAYLLNLWLTLAKRPMPGIDGVVVLPPDVMPA